MGGDDVVVGHLGQIEAADFGPDMRAQRNDIELRRGHHRHGGSSLGRVGEPACHSAAAGAMSCAALPCSTSPLAKAATIFATISHTEAPVHSTATQSFPHSSSFL